MKPPTKQEIEELIEEMKESGESIDRIRYVELAVDTHDVEMNEEDIDDLESCAIASYQSITSIEFTHALLYDHDAAVQMALAPIVVAYRVGILRGRKEAQNGNDKQ